MKNSSWILIVLSAFFLAAAGLPQSASCAVDTTPPTGKIVINDNRSATNNVAVTLTLTYADEPGGSGVARMRFSDDGAHWTAWQALAPSLSYTLPSGDGHKTVRVQYLDKANNRSAVYSDYIRLDTAAPTGGVVINGGAVATVTETVALSLTWADDGAGVSRMRFSDNGSNWTPWELPSAVRSHILPTALGNHTVRVQFRDGADNYSTVYNDYIKVVASRYAGVTQTVLLPGNVPLVLAWIPAGTFQMGRYTDEPDSSAAEDPQHSVTLGGFWMAQYELTQRQWTAAMGTAPWTGHGDMLTDPDSPAVYVNWDDAQSFVTALQDFTGKSFHLPSEAQWEYACRGGTTTRFYWGEDAGLAGDYAWWWANVSPGYTHVVGQKLPNALWLYDMIGNVGEWCEDDTHPNYEGAPTGGEPWVDDPRGEKRQLRGGSMWDGVIGIRSAYRCSLPPSSMGNDKGFRVACMP